MGYSKRSPQRSFLDPEVVLQTRPLKPGSFSVRFREVCDRVIPDSLFDDLYSSNGRPAFSPSALMRLQLLMQRDGCGDEAAVENLLYDVRWQYMCALPLDQCGIHPTTLHYFRVRLLFGTIKRDRIAALLSEGIVLRQAPAQRLLEATKRAAVELGILDPEAAQYVDSTPIFGAAAVQDTFSLLFGGLREVLRAHEAAVPESHGALVGSLRRAEYVSGVKKPEIDWQDAATREALLVDFVRDAATLVSVGESVDTPAMREALAQLQRLLAQDVEISPEGKAALRQGVAPDRQCSLVDPEMRHGRKSKSRRFNGYKGHVVAEPKSGLVTAVEASLATVHDGAAVPDLLEQTQPALLGGDNAYAGAEVRAEALSRGTVILTPTRQAEPFDKDCFEIDETTGTSVCPAGKTATIGKNGRVHFPAKDCRQCPFGGQCNPSGKGRTITFGPHESLQRSLRAAARTESGAAFTRARCAIERIIAHYVRWGARQGRYFGRLKTALQALFAAVGYNLDKLGRHCVRLAEKTTATR